MIIMNCNILNKTEIYYKIERVYSNIHELILSGSLMSGIYFHSLRETLMDTIITKEIQLI